MTGLLLSLSFALSDCRRPLLSGIGYPKSFMEDVGRRTLLKACLALEAGGNGLQPCNKLLLNT